MKSSRRFFPVFLAVVLSLRCSVPVANDGGGATETVNCRVLSSTGIPEQGAVVKLIDAGNWLEKKKNSLSVVIDSAVTDSNGVFALTADTGVVVNMQIDGFSEAVFISNFSIKSEDTTVTLRSKAVLSGNLSGPEIGAVALFGTDYMTTINGSSFSIQGIAPGNFPLLTRLQDSTWAFSDLVVLTDAESLEKNIEVDAQFVLVDNFDHFRLLDFSILGLITGGNWYTYCDSLSSINAVSTPEPDRSLAVNAIVNPGLEYPYAGVGVNMARSGMTLDFSAVDTISFRARGNCSIRFSVETEKIDLLNSSHFQKLIGLTDVWTVYEIAVSDLILPSISESAGLGLTWEQVMSNVKRVEFDLPYDENPMGDSLGFELDDLYLKGATLEDLILK